MPLRKLTGTIMPLRKLTGSLFSLKCPEHVSRDSCGKSPLLREMDRTPLGVSCRSQTTRSLVADPEKQRGEQIERQAPTALARLCRPRAARVDCRLGLLPDDWEQKPFELCFRTGELRYVSKRRAASHYCSRFAPGTTVVVKVDADTRIEKGPLVQCSMPSASGARLRLHTLLICQTSSGLKLRDASSTEESQDTKAAGVAVKESVVLGCEDSAEYGRWLEGLTESVPSAETCCFCLPPSLPSFLPPSLLQPLTPPSL